MANTTTTTTDGDLCRLEIQCPGCDRWESVDVPTAGLAGYNAGELTDRQAFPNNTFEEHTLIECGWHVDCWDNAVHGHHR